MSTSLLSALKCTWNWSI